MKKVIAISSVLLGVVFLTGCGQQPVSQTQPTAPAPVAQTPVASTLQTPQVKEDTSWKTYVNKAAGYQITFPDSWKGYKTEDDGKGTLSFKIKFPYSYDIFADGSSELIMFNIITMPISSQTNEDEIDCKKGLAPYCYFTINRLAKTSANVIYYIRGDEMGDMEQFKNKSSEIKNRFGEIDSILKTFQLTK